MKAILITGTSSGIGYALLQKYLNHKFHIFGVSRNVEPLQKLSSDNLTIIKADITLEDNRNDIVNIMMSKLQTINNVKSINIINNATYGQPDIFKNTGIDEIRLHFETNFFAPIQLLKDILCKININRVLNISSGAAEFPLKNLLSYCTSKASIHHAIKCLNLEYPNTKFTNLRPGMVDTPLQERWRNLDDGIFMNNNPYILAKENNKLLNVGIVADYIYNVMQSPEELFLQEWNIYNKEQQKQLQLLTSNHYL